MHYEEYGLELAIQGEIFAWIKIGGTDKDVYYFKWLLEADFINFEPYKQIIFWQRPISTFFNSTYQVMEYNAWLGASYDLKLGSIVLSYEESLAIGGQNLLGMLTDNLADTGFWWWLSAGIDDDENTNEWDDPFYTLEISDLFDDSNLSVFKKAEYYLL
mmetsp:Transcript_14616/g.14240  ORF Transcript_14616/g.14240 Transcript_14616/m.14240 type:complete len:159 (+) Transcript_14616:226-702(+)